VLSHACRAQAKSAEPFRSATEREGTQRTLVARSKTHGVSFSPGRLAQLWSGSVSPWLAQRLHTSRRRGTRLPSGLSPSETAGVLHPTSSRIGCLDCWGSPVKLLRAAPTTPSCSDLLRELSFTHSTKPNFPAARKIFKCLTDCAQSPLRVSCCLPLLTTPPHTEHFVSSTSAH
jgi:hypothetical protein